MASPSKRQKIANACNNPSNENTTRTTQKRLIEHKVLCCKDYLSHICFFLKIKDIFSTISPLSVFHYDFTNNIQQSKLIYQCIEYDFGKKYLHLLNIKIDFVDNNKDNEEDDNNTKTISVSSQLYPLFTSWSFIHKTAIESPNIDYSGNMEGEVFDFSLLSSFKSFKVFKYWYDIVKCRMFFNKQKQSLVSTEITTM